MDSESDSKIVMNMSGCLDFGDDNFTIGSWEHKELVRKDGQMNLTSKVNFASIGKQSECVIGESPFIAFVAVIVGWLHNNPNYMSIKSQFDIFDMRRIFRVEKVVGNMERRL
jgi:hypothetical protein